MATNPAMALIITGVRRDGFWIGVVLNMRMAKTRLGKHPSQGEPHLVEAYGGRATLLLFKAEIRLGYRGQKDRHANAKSI